MGADEQNCIEEWQRQWILWVRPVKLIHKVRLINDRPALIYIIEIGFDQAIHNVLWGLGKCIRWYAINLICSVSQAILSVGEVEYMVMLCVAGNLANEVIKVRRLVSDITHAALLLNFGGANGLYVEELGKIAFAEAIVIRLRIFGHGNWRCCFDIYTRRRACIFSGAHRPRRFDSRPKAGERTQDAGPL